MQVQVLITIATADDWGMSVDEAAHAVLVALNGDEAKDLCSVTVSGSGYVGVSPVAPPPVEVPPVVPPGGA